MAADASVSDIDNLTIRLPIPPDLVLLPRHEDLFLCLDRALDGWVYRKLRASFPDQVVRDARDVTWNRAAVAILSGAAGVMSSAARRRWLLIYARRDAATVAKRHRYSRRRPLPADHPAPVADEGPRLTVLARFRAVAQGLSHDEKRALLAVHYRGLSGREAAERLGWPPSTLRYRLASAEHHLLERSVSS